MTFPATAPEPEEASPAFHRRLRADTTASHQAVDAAFGGFRLDLAGSYRGFLHAHATVLPGWERALVMAGLLDPARAREPLLHADLEALDTRPPPVRAVQESPAGLWGALYVLEGSRLGGGMLARSVGEGLPSAYLGAKHLPGEWRDTLARIDAAAGDEAWQTDALAGAARVFADYLAAGLGATREG